MASIYMVVTFPCASCPCCSGAQPGRDFHHPPFEATTELLDRITQYREQVEARVALAEARGEPPDDGELLAEMKAFLEQDLGIPAPSFDAEQRLPSKAKGERIEIGKLLALCPYKGTSAG